MSLLLALDVGTSSARAALFEPDGRRIGASTAQRSYELHTDGGGMAEIEPEELRSSVLECLEETLTFHQRNDSFKGRPIVAAGTSCFWHGMIGTDLRGKAMTRVVTWADSRPSPIAKELRQILDEAEVHSRTGCMLRASFWPAKLRWFAKADGDLFPRVQKWMSAAEWLHFEICGRAHCGLAMATGTGLLAHDTLRWDAEMLKISGVSADKLNPLEEGPMETGDAFAERFPALAETRWFPALGDGAASNLGSGAMGSGVAAINVGTSAAIRIMKQDEPARAPFGLFCYRVDRERFLVGGAVSNAGNLREWCLRELNLGADHAKVEKALAEQSLPTHGLSVLPFWSAERAPTWNEELTGTIVGISQSTTSLDLLQAITEATYHRIARIADLLFAHEESAAGILVSGGIQNSTASMQRLANVLGRTIHANPEPEASVRGAAIYVMEKLGWPVPPVKFGTAIEPEAGAATAYKADRARQTALEERMSK